MMKVYNLVDGVLVPTDNRKNCKKLYLSKEDFDSMYSDTNLTKIDMQRLGVGSKLFLNSYHFHYPDRAVRAKMAGQKIRISQKKNNSNKPNFGKPRKLLDRFLLQEHINNGKSIGELSVIFGCSEPTIHTNIIYHDIETWSFSKLRGNRYLALKQLSKFSGVDFVKMLGGACVDTEQLRLYIKQLEIDLQQCKETLQALRHSYCLGSSCVGKSRYERYVRQYLDDINELYVPQYKIGKFYFDFYLPDRGMLIEVDGEGHSTKYELEKSNIDGFVLLRLDFTHLKSKKQCIQQVQSSISKALE